MANHPSALKRYRQSQKRELINSKNGSKLKTQLKKLKTAIAAKKSGDARELLPTTFSLIDKSVQKGVIKKNTAARYKSRLTRSVNTIPTT
jgi:small subunit ribosomal protein S20